MSNQKIINIGIIGIGTIGKRHLMAINEVDDINIVGIVDVAEQRINFVQIKIFPFLKP